jgi:ferritin-like metal-binding protein YciE
MSSIAPNANANIAPLTPEVASAVATPSTITREHFLDWLRDAHAMEEQAETMMTAMSSRLEHYPALKQRIDLHIEETREQQRMLQTVLARYDTDTSTFKDLTGKVMATVHGAASMFASDEVLKGGWMSYAFEHFEIATYTTLIAGAQALGDMESVRVFETILAQEQAMGDWLAEHLPETTKTYLAIAEQADSGTAKR